MCGIQKHMKILNFQSCNYAHVFIFIIDYVILYGNLLQSLCSISH